MSYLSIQSFAYEYLILHFPITLKQWYNTKILIEKSSLSAMCYIKKRNRINSTNNIIRGKTANA